MQLPSWMRGSRSIEAAIFLFAVLLVVVGFNRGWHHAIPGVSGPVSDPHAGHDHDPDPHAGHNHGPDEPHDEPKSIELSVQARRTLGLKTGIAELGTFVRRISTPATIVDWPGRTHVEVSAPMTGTVTKIHVAHGQTISSGDQLYTLRLTHQDLVRAQTEFLRLIGEADVVQREIERLGDAARSGAIAKKSLLESQYNFDKLKVDMAARRESLLLHGLSEPQVQSIERDRRLIREIVVVAPTLHADLSLHSDAISHPEPSLPPAGLDLSDVTTEGNLTASGRDSDHVETQFVVTELLARRGQSIETGHTLTLLADYSHLFAEGLAFQQDTAAINTAMANRWPVQAVFENVNPLDTSKAAEAIVNDLLITYVSGEVREVSRALPFFVPLENEVLQIDERENGSFVGWRFRPGQRLRLRVPVDQLTEVFVLPVDAVAKEGAESYVFVENSDHFDRLPVSIALRDQMHVAVAYDGSIFPGDTIVMRGAHQLQMALKNKSGGAVDPHAGHNH